MKLRVLIGIFSFCAISNIVAAMHAPITEDAFLSTFTVDNVSCRPGVIAGENGEPIKNSRSLLSTFKGTIACMLKGLKNVYYYQGNPTTLSKEVMDIEHLLAAKKFSYFPISNQVMIIFSPAGKEQALLLAKSHQEGVSQAKNCYSMGYLLGYPEEDIKAFFKKIETSDISKFQQETLAWIDREKNTIDKWAKENLSVYNFSPNSSLLETKEKDIKDVKESDQVQNLISTYLVTDTTCRPTINADNASVIPDTLKDRLGCLFLNKQKIWFGDAGALNFIHELSPEARQIIGEEIKIIYLKGMDILSKPAKILAYTQSYEDEAQLLEKYFKHVNNLYIKAKTSLESSDIKKEGQLLPIILLVPSFYKEHIKKMNKDEINSFLHKPDKDLYMINHYLVGHLLGYQEKDIRSFYNKISSKEFPLALAFEEHKNKALKWIEDNKLAKASPIPTLAKK